MKRREKSNFMSEKPDKYYLKQLVQVNMNGDNSC